MKGRKAKALRYAPQGELSIYTAMEQKEQLLRVLEKADVAELDLTQVSLLDSSGVQLLLLAKREASRLEKPFSIVGLSSAVSEVLELCNLAGHFGEQVFIPSSAAGEPA
jgi:anti-sigma B factor antagonist